ncbi:hypothetical protein [Neobacillus citreus]|uniref:Uncharacterized protein n=1 Tax=Neobacillus citreus TaxID=2833578 RepID=A0A942T2G5_9BACI|nr:hypothetical protein [Neobacillus citreus]MCH6266592.1 hypothetical protein [Neobacillus citreus]
MKLKLIAILLSLFLIVILEGCNTQNKADIQSEKLASDYENYIQKEILVNKPFKSFITSVNVKVIDKYKTAANIGHHYYYDYGLEVETSPAFLNLSKQQKYEQITDLASSLSSIPAASRYQGDEELDESDAVYLSEDFKHTLHKEQIIFISGKDRYRTDIKMMSASDRYNYKQPYAESMEILYVNDKENIVKFD